MVAVADIESRLAINSRRINLICDYFLSSSFSKARMSIFLASICRIINFVLYLLIQLMAVRTI